MKIVEYDKNEEIKDKKTPINVDRGAHSQKRLPVRNNISKRKLFSVEGKISFVYKDYTKEGIISCILCIISIIIMIACIAITINDKGLSGIYLGNLGFLSFIIAFFALIITLRSFKIEDYLEYDFLLSRIGLYVSIFILIIWSIIFIRGWILIGI